MAHPQHPQEGARFELVRQRSAESEATYEARLYMEDAQYLCEIDLSLAADGPAWGSVEATPAEAPPLPEWMVKHTNALLRQCFSQARKKGTWPRRIRRWRDAPQAKETTP